MYEMKKLLLLLILSIGFGQIFGQGTSCGNAINLGTPNSNQVCLPLSTVGSGSAPCAGSGYGGSGGYVYFTFCTNSNNDCIVFDIQDGSTSGNWAIRVYDVNCATTVYHTDCIGNSGSGGTATSIDWGLSPNTCYTARLWVKNPGNFTMCLNTVVYPNDECSTATPIDQNPLSDDNYCSTGGPTTNSPTLSPADFCAGSLENTAWYSFTVLNTADVIVTIENISCSNGAQGFQIGYFVGSCGSLIPIGCQSGAGGTVTATITGLTSGEEVYVGIDGNAGANCTYEISATNTVLLNNEIEKFDLVNNPNDVDLIWNVEGDDISHYIIERSQDGINFHEVGEVYQNNLTDYNPLSGVSYYRLNIVRLNGNKLTSRVISATRKEEKLGLNIHNVYPQPSSGVLTIDLGTSNSDIVYIKVVNSIGQIVFLKELETEPNSRHKVDLNLDLSSGVYNLVIEDGKSISKLKRIIITN